MFKGMKWIFFVIIFLCQISPVVLVPIVSSVYGVDRIHRDLFYGDCIQDMVDEKLDRYAMDYAEQGRSAEEAKAEALKYIEVSYSGMCGRLSEKKARTVDMPAVFLLIVFFVVPSTWVANKIKDALNGKVDRFRHEIRRLKFKGVITAIFMSMSVVLITLVGFSIVWRFCLNNIASPAFVQLFGFILGLPLLITIGVLADAFGRSYAFSGKRAHEEAFEMLKDKSNDSKS